MPDQIASKDCSHETEIQWYNFFPQVSISIIEKPATIVVLFDGRGPIKIVQDFRKMFVHIDEDTWEKECYR